MDSESRSPRLQRLAPLLALALAAACTESQPTAPERELGGVSGAVPATFSCHAQVVERQVSCESPQPSRLPPGLRPTTLGGQNTYVKLTSSNISASGGIFQFDVTVQNLLREAIGTPDGTTPDPEGIRVFFHVSPRLTGGTGDVSVANADGTGSFTGSGQPFFRYTEILTQDEVSAPRTWQIAYDPGVTSFEFKVYVETEVQPLLVINEVMTNPDGTSDVLREWFEIYNAGSLAVEMQGMVIADSAASGRRPYHLVSSSLRVPPGGYVVLGNSTNTTDNGGVPVDYAYGSALLFANSLDAVKVARVFGTDTLTLDRTQYASPVSTQNGISRELKNPSLENANMDGSNWADASVTAVYGPGGRGTPGAQNSTYTP